MDNPIEHAAARFAEGFNCAQAVFSAFAPALGLDETTALRIASPLGGGIGRSGNVCGAVTGALMALGLGRGASTPEGKEPTYLIAKEFIRRFQEKHGTILCNALTGYDISTPEGIAAARESGRFKEVCPFVVRDAAQIAAAMLAEKEGQ